MALTEAQTRELLAKMRQRLVVLEEEIARKLGQASEEFSAFDRVGDSGDLSTLLNEGEVEMSEALRDIEEWRGLRGALRRVDEGTYGVCVDCGTEIRFERLSAAPMAMRCIDCQVQAERREPSQPSSM